ncbi:hypothetical protein BVG16_02190 [Paenibacillus selenitireducens]|uniref:Transcription factor zinc-finger domain-containing protein n=1 Tax=Paenibacillus selenitireducens TaxID=1324314 RepID=A0A1T2XN52_9BACL|nr:zf-TFIIB domain-containing protein [Paenibacillus selenitireducens]OPA81166.1 hypothetical protein BVG16_02190 [Paenibacillus selenitireducens]
MNCPVCNDMRMREIQKDGILIDVCPQCKGVWLDRGELEKLMSGVREIRQDFNQWNDQRETKSRDDYYPQQSQDSSHHHNTPHYNKHKKKKSVLDVFGDLFD